MAILNKFKKTDSQEQVNTPSNQSGFNLSGQSAYSAPSSGQDNPTAPTSSGRFTNLQNYLKANEGFKKEEGGLAGGIYSNIADKAQKVESSSTQAADTVKQQQDANRVQYDQNIVDQIKTNPYEYITTLPYQNTTGPAQSGEGLQLGGSPPPSSGGFASNDPQDKVVKFSQLRDAVYQGPTDYDVSQYINDASKVQSLSSLAQNEKDRPTVLKTLYNTPSYSQGQQSLDNLLLQANPEQAAKLQQLVPLTSNLTSNIESQQQEVMNRAQDFQTEAANTQSQTRNALLDAINKYYGDAEGNLQGVQTQAEQVFFPGVKSMLSNRSITEEDAQRFNLVNAPYRFYGEGADASKAFVPLVNNANISNALTPELARQIEALRTLSGDTMLGSELLGKIDTSQAGTFDPRDSYRLDSKVLQDLTALSEQNLMKEYERLGTQHLNLLASQRDEVEQVKRSWDQRVDTGDMSVDQMEANKTAKINEINNKYNSLISQINAAKEAAKREYNQSGFNIGGTVPTGTIVDRDVGSRIRGIN